MPFPIHIDILNFIFKGMLIGIIASAPMGPVGVLCVQRTLNKGRWYGFVTGIGAAVSDIIYAVLTVIGMSFVMDFINDQDVRFLLQIVGSIILMAFGVYTYRTDSTKNIRKPAAKTGTLVYNGVTAFLVTFSNPLIIFLFLACYAQFAFVMPGYSFEMAVGLLSILAGALFWWFGLTWLLDKIRGKFDVAGIRLINQIIGALVVFGSVVMLFGTITNLFRFD